MPSRLALILAAVGLLLLAQPAQARIGDVRTWMSKPYAGDGGDARQAWLDSPGGFAAGSQCTLYVADTINNVVRRIDGNTNIITTFAGSGHYGSTDGPARKASFSTPEDVALDSNGVLYVADTGSGKVRTVNGGLVRTWLTRLNRPMGLLIDGTTVYVSEYGGNKIMKATIGSPAKSTFALITSPGKMLLYNDDLYVLHGKSTSLSKISLATGLITGIKNDFVAAEGLALRGDQIVIVAGRGILNEVWAYTPATGAIVKESVVPETEWYNHQSDVTYCGSSPRVLFRSGASIYNTFDNDSDGRIAGIHRWGDRDGLRSVALVGRPWGLALTADKKKFYLLENHKIKEFDLTTNTLKFLIGHADDNYVDGVGSVARISGATQIAISPDAKKIYIPDRNNNRIRVLNLATNELTTLTGAGRVNMFNNQNNAYAEGGPCPDTLTTGVAGCAYFNRPDGIVVSKDGKKLYVSDSSNSRIRTVDTATGQTSLLVGGTKGFRDGVGGAARLSRPGHLLLSQDGKKLYLVDYGNHAIRQIDIATKRVTKLVGKGTAGYRNGRFTDAFLSYPDSLAQGPGNTLFLSEVGSQRIRRLNLDTRTIVTLAGSGRRGMRNGRAADASFHNPRGLIMVGSKLLVADSLNDLIRSVSLR